MTAYAPTSDQAEAATLCVIRHAGDDATARELLDMLGLAVPDSPGTDEPRADGTKTCTSCGETKSRIEFYVLRTTNDGRRAQCKECVEAKRRCAPREVPPCGTVAAYSRHKRYGEEVDDACADARRSFNRTYLRAWRANKK